MAGCARHFAGLVVLDSQTNPVSIMIPFNITQLEPVYGGHFGPIADLTRVSTRFL
jgi:hypothetical protein